MKRFICIILCTVLSLSALLSVSNTAYAAEFRHKSGDFVYTIRTDGTVQIKRYKGNDEKVSVPSSIDGRRVTALGELSFLKIENLTEVELPETITEIGTYAFSESKKLKTVIIKGNISEIPYGAFWNCYSFEKITIPESVTKISYGAFTNCRKMEALKLPDGVREIESRAFLKCVSLTSITIPEGIKRLNPNCFYGCKKLERISLPSTLKEIGTDTFCGCASLKSIQLPEGLKSIDYGAFSQCKSLDDITFPSTLEHVGASVLYKTPFYETEEYQSGSKLIYKDGILLYCGSEAPEIINVDDGTRVIADSVFSRRSLREITLPDSLKYIGNDAFWYSELTKINGGKNVKACGEDVIVNTNLEREINKSSSGVLTIGKCIAAVSKKYKGKLKIDKSIEAAAPDAFNGCKSLNAFSVSESNKYFCSKNGVLFNKKMTALISYPRSKKDKKYAVPRGVKVLKKRAFYANRYLEKISIAGKVKTIEEGCFYSCNALKSVKLGKSIKVIEYDAFTNCSKLKLIYLPPSLTAIGGIVSGWCDSGIKIKGYSGSTAEKEAKYISEEFIPIYATGKAKANYKGSKGGFTVYYKGVKNADGFEVRYSKGKYVQLLDFDTKKAAKKHIKGLTKGKYKVKIRAYKKVRGQKLYGKWSQTKKIIVK